MKFFRQRITLKLLCSLVLYIILGQVILGIQFSAIPSFFNRENTRLSQTYETVWIEQATTKIFQSYDSNDALFTIPTNQNTIHLRIAKNSFEMFQLVISTGATEKTGITLSPSALSNPNASISASNIKLFQEYYVHVRDQTLYESVLDYALGYYPDALIPVTSAIDIPSNHNQPFLIEVSVPKDTPAGIYNGTISISGGLTEVINYSVEVLDYELPSRTQLFNPGYLDLWELPDMLSLSAEEKTQLFQAYVKFFAERDINVGGSYDAFGYPTKIQGDWDFKQWWERMKPIYTILFTYFEPAVLQIPLTFDVLGIPEDEWTSEDAQQEYLAFLGAFKSWEQTMESKGEIPHNTIWYVWLEELDEPDTDLKAWLIGKYAELTASIRDNAFPIQYRVDGTIDWLDENVQWDLDVDTTDWTNLQDSFTIWQAPQEDLEFDPSFIQYQVTHNRKVVIYQQAWSAYAITDDPEEKPPGATTRNYEFPSLPGIVNPALFHRVLPWIVWKYNASGIGFWSLMAWYNANSGSVLDMFVDNPALNIYEGSNERIQNGDGWLVYPGNRVSEHTAHADVVGPVSSLRLELLRKGLEDYKYLQLLKENYLNFTGTKRNQAILLLKSINNLIKTITDFNRDTQQYDNIITSIQDLFSQEKNTIRFSLTPLNWSTEFNPPPVTTPPPDDFMDYIIIGTVLALVIIMISVGVWYYRKKSSRNQ